MEVFSKRFRDLIITKDIKIKNMSKETGIGIKTLYQYQNDEIEPKASYIAIVAKYFGVTADYLLGLENEFGSKIN